LTCSAKGTAAHRKEEQDSSFFYPVTMSLRWSDRSPPFTILTSCARFHSTDLAYGFPQDIRIGFLSYSLVFSWIMDFGSSKDIGQVFLRRSLKPVLHRLGIRLLLSIGFHFKGTTRMLNVSLFPRIIGIKDGTQCRTGSYLNFRLRRGMPVHNKDRYYRPWS
jgi:hypothetical protein